MKTDLKTISILGVKITAANEEEILELIARSLEKSGKNAVSKQGKLSSQGKALFITTPNPEMVVYASKNPRFKQILQDSQIAIPDGIGLIIAAKILGLPLHSRITGADLVEKLCYRLSKHITSGSKHQKSIAKKPVSLGFLGGRGGVAEQTADRLRLKYPGLNVVFVGEEWTGFKKEIDILFVAFGFPKQEEWIHKNLPDIPVRVAMGVGGTFDFISGKVPRAPIWVRSLGLEWLYRLIRQPWRWKRQLALIEFIFLVFKEWWRLRLSPNDAQKDDSLATSS